MQISSSSSSASSVSLSNRFAGWGLVVLMARLSVGLGCRLRRLSCRQFRLLASWFTHSWESSGNSWIRYSKDQLLQFLSDLECQLLPLIFRALALFLRLIHFLAVQDYALLHSQTCSSKMFPSAYQKCLFFYHLMSHSNLSWLIQVLQIQTYISY